MWGSYRYYGILPANNRREFFFQFRAEVFDEVEDEQVLLD